MLDKLEKAMPCMRMCGRARLDTAAARWKAAIQIPLMSRLLREGMVALGDVFVPCLVVADFPVPGRKPASIDVLVLDFTGSVSVIACSLQARGATAVGASRLADADRRLRAAVHGPEDIEALYRKARPRGHEKERLVDLANATSEETTPRLIERLPALWASCIGAGRAALYLAMDRKPEMEPSGPREPILPMTTLLASRSGGIFEIEPPPASPRDPGKYLKSLEEPARTIWIYRRKIG